ncbi:MAG: molecular chaperone DnaJ [Candidatus Zixiibacteriota bacterium]
MAKRDYYEVLGLDRDATEEDIKKVYRKLALQYHPDRNPGNKESEEKFKEATEAYEVLKDPEKKATYDRYGHAGVGTGAGFGGFDFSTFDLSDALRAFMRDFGSFSIFDEFFGQTTRTRRRGGPRGKDLQVKLKLTLEEIATGVDKKIKLKRMVICDECRGTGAAQGTSKTTCPRCQGAGQIRKVKRTFLGQFVNVTTCDYCQGEGQVIQKPCPACSGQGRVKGTSTISVKVPPGVVTGNYIPIRESGDIGPRGGPPGDLIVLMEEQEHDLFRRHEDDLIYELPVSFSQAALGDQIEVPTLDGKINVKIPSGTQSGKIFRLKGKGILHLHGYGKGDELVRIVVWTPTRLSQEEKRLLEKLAQSPGSKPPKAGKSFFDKLKESLGM